MAKKIQRAITSHPNRGLGDNLIVTCKGDEIEVYVEGGSRLASLPVSQMKGPYGSKAERVAELLSDLEEAETQAKSAASRASRQGFSYEAIYTSSKKTMMASHGWPKKATKWAEGVLSMAVQLEAARVGRPAH